MTAPADVGLVAGPNISNPAPTSVDLLTGWSDFANIWRLADMSVVLGLALLLGAIIAYHPLSRSKISSIEELDHMTVFSHVYFWILRGFFQNIL